MKTRAERRGGWRQGGGMVDGRGGGSWDGFVLVDLEKQVFSLKVLLPVARFACFLHGRITERRMQSWNGEETMVLERKLAPP